MNHPRSNKSSPGEVGSFPVKLNVSRGFSTFSPKSLASALVAAYWLDNSCFKNWPHLSDSKIAFRNLSGISFGTSISTCRRVWVFRRRGREHERRRLKKKKVGDGTSQKKSQRSGQGKQRGVDWFGGCVCVGVGRKKEGKQFPSSIRGI